MLDTILALEILYQKILKNYLYCVIYLIESSTA